MTTPALPARILDSRKPARTSFKNDVIVVAIRVAIAIGGIVPARVLIFVLGELGRAAFHVLAYERRIALENVARAFPSTSKRERRAIAKRAFLQAGKSFAQTAMWLYRSPDAFLKFEEGSREILDEAISAGHGVLLASAHLGPYELVASSLTKEGVELLAVTKGAYDRRIDFVYTRLRRSLGVHAVARENASAPITMIRHLRKGRVLGIPMDLASRVPSIDAPFFDVLAKTAVGPARIALRTNARVVVCTAAKDATEKLALRVTAIDTSDLGATENDERTLTTRINAELSKRIRAMPSSWLFMHDRFARIEHKPTPRVDDPLVF